jgi:site-specific DNA-methyltransferase (cytosine-N4-specific)
VTKKSETQSLECHQEIPEAILVMAERTGLAPKAISELSLSQILTGLQSPDKHVKGRALELLAIHFTCLIDLDFKDWLLRSVDSNYIEVGIVANGRQVPFSRWLIQCRDARQMGMGEIAMAVGRGISFRPNVVLSVTTGRFTPQARHYATKAMQLTNLQILLIDTHDLGAIASGEMTVQSILSRETEWAQSAKELQLAHSIPDIAGVVGGHCS